ncbi:hypothetical protein [Paenibacillus turpanensis]|uniref:hypothetical protein n=1 Tax=Paenibacillus turpanensis TaxID=2689078 RepID=UPI00140C8BEB|nr:hypothetical protein [Paenibacillus turpanensis]
MGSIRAIFSITRADLLERIRQFSFLAAIGLSMLIAYFFVPPMESGYITLHLGENYRGVYNSAWVGGTVALSTALFLTLFGFFLVKNSIQRDYLSGVGQIIASTPVNKLAYLTGKTISNFAVLTLIVAAVAATALVMQLVRGEVLEIELWPLVSPFIFVTLPIMSVVAAIAVIFETRPLLQGGIGNVLFFVLYFVFVVSSNETMSYGVSVVTSDMVKEMAAIKPDFSGTYGIGILVPDQPIELFVWQGLDWTTELVMQQSTFLLAAAAAVLVAALLFPGFQDPRGRRLSKQSVQALQPNSEPYLEALPVVTGHPVSQIRADELTPATGKSSLAKLIAAEWWLLTKKTSTGWYVIAGILSILCLAIPSAVSIQWMLWPILWIWPMLLWSQMGSREAVFHTQFLMVSSPYGKIRQYIAVWTAGVLLTFLVVSPMLLRLLFEHNVELLAYGITGVFLIPSFALVCGVLTNTSRTFEVLYMIVWYLGPVNKTPVFNFLGTSSTDGSWFTDAGMMIPLYLVSGIALLASGYLFRNRFMRAR